ncbi:uncharacterized protein BDV14DRAFT_194687 [Aspergillus stella-maris]|uniref:uncharacterized protein n=1 Tax=Aspergillus stella-maris TaxID=1810926 RepID=UPI003CCCAB6D
MLFAKLPEEILWHIITTYLDRDSQTLALLASLNKRFHRITTPILYSHVTLALDDVDESRKVRRFIASVHSSPYIAQCVRSLELNELSWVPHESLPERRKELVARMIKGNIIGRSDRLDMFKLVTVVRRLPLLDKHKHKWCTELQEVAPSLDSLVALILVFLPSLERLESNWSLDPVFIRHLLPQADMKKVDSSPSPIVLRNLLHLKVTSQSPCGDSSEILPFFQMPSLTHFFGSNWGPIRSNGWDNGVEVQSEGDKGPIASSMKHLELRYCNIDLYSLQTILKYSRSVRTFILHRDWDPRIYVRLSAVSIIEALRPLWKTLENIVLSFEPGLYIHQEGEIHPLDFSKFSVLANLYVAAGYLIHDPQDFDTHEFSKLYNTESDEPIIQFSLHDRLPESLEVLRITGFSTPQQMQLLIDDCCRMLQRRSRVSRLRELSIEAPFDDPNSFFDTRALQQEALRKDVLFRKIDNKSWLNDGHELLTPAGCDWGMDGEHRWSTKLF